MKTTNKIAFYNILSTVVLQGLTFFTAPIISRVLGTNNYGITSVCVTWTALFCNIFGLQTQSTIALAKGEYKETEQKKYQSSILMLSLCMYMCFSGLVILFIKPFAQVIHLETAIVLILLVQGFGQFCVNFLNIKFTYEFKAKFNFFLTVSLSIATLGLSLVLINLFPAETNYWGRILGLAIPYILFGVVIAFLVFGKGKCFFNKEYWRFCIPLCLPIVVHSVSGLLLNQSARVMIQNMTGNSEAGVYSLVYSFTSVLSVIWTALNNSWVPFFYDCMNKKEVSEVRTHAKNCMELFTVLAMGFLLLATEVYHLFAGKDYWGGTSLIQILVIGFYMMFMYSFPVNYEFYRKKTKAIATGTMLAAVANVILNIVLIPLYGITGAALATTASYIVQYAFHHFSAKRLSDSQEEYPFKFCIMRPYLIVFLLTVILSIALQEVALVRWIIAICIGLWELWRIYQRKIIF